MKQTYTFRFDNAIHAELKAKANSEGVTISAYLELLVRLALGANDPKCGNVITAPATRDEVLDQVVEDMPVIDGDTEHPAPARPELSDTPPPPH